MKRYNVPRIAFINKLDREGSDPFTVIEQLRSKLKLNAAATQLPIGLSKEHAGVIDLVAMEAIYFEGPNGETPVHREIPAEMIDDAQAARAEMLERLADVDEEVADLFLAEEEPPLDVLRAAIRRRTIAREFVPVFMGSAFKNKGVHPLLDGVTHYLPSPTQVENVALDLKNNEEQVVLSGNPRDPLVGLAFKLEEGRFGQLTYMRIYQGSVSRGDTIVSMATGDRVRLPKLVRMHSNDMEEVESAAAGDIVAMFGVDLGRLHRRGHPSEHDVDVRARPGRLARAQAQGPQLEQFLEGARPLHEGGPHVPRAHGPRVGRDDHLGDGRAPPRDLRGAHEPRVRCRVRDGRAEGGHPGDGLQARDVQLHAQKQSGGSGQFAKLEGYIEPLDPERIGSAGVEFRNDMMGNNIPPEFIPAIVKGFNEAFGEGVLAGAPVMGVRVVLEDGAAHSVDSNEVAFRSAAKGAFRQAMTAATRASSSRSWPSKSRCRPISGRGRGAAVAAQGRRQRDGRH